MIHKESFLKKSLISDTIRLFAVMANADGVVTEQESEYLKKYLASQYPDFLTEQFMKLFYEFVQEKESAKKVCGDLKSRLKPEDRVFIIMKITELMAADEIDAAELALLKKMTEEFSISKQDIEVYIKIIDATKGTDVLSSSSDIRIVRINNDPLKSDVFLPYPNLDLLVISVGKMIMLVQKDKENHILIEHTVLKNNFTYKAINDSPVIINHEYHILQEDLKFYYKFSGNSRSESFLAFDHSENIIPATGEADALLKFELQGCKIFLTPMNNTKLEVNNEIIKQRQLINLNDTVFCRDLKVNIRNLAFQKDASLESEVKIVPDVLYTVGNKFINDIFIDDSLDTSWRCNIVFKKDGYTLDVHECPFPVFVNNKTVRSTCDCRKTDTIRILNYSIAYSEASRSFSVKRASFQKLVARRLQYKFRDKNTGVDEVSFRANKGELIGIMGPSGCGKTTLLNILIGNLAPKSGNVSLDSYDIHENIKYLKDSIGIVPQDDLLFENLTVYQNLYFNALLRFPDGQRNIDLLVSKVLRDINLWDKKDIQVGSPLNKILSGGERKRVNIGLELLSESDIVMFDEPTSGLSSKDSEKIIQLLQNLAAKGKILFSVIHQPSTKLFMMFDKIMLLDQGGKLVFYGDVYEAFEYFKKYSPDSGEIISPDLLLDTLEQPLQDIDGKSLHIRKYTPAFWKAEFEKYKAEKEIEQQEPEVSGKMLPAKRKSLKVKLRIFYTLLRRNFINKFKDKTNLVITFVLPPLLAVFIGGILRYSPSGKYVFFENQHIGTFLFLVVLIAIFLGVTNSIEEIIKDEKMLVSEKRLSISKLSYYLSKFLTLVPFAIIQNTIFVVIGYMILEGREFYLMFIFIATLVSINGIALGLLISSLPKLTSKAAINFIPLILIPQIIFGGGLVKYEEMSKQMVFFENSPVPEVCQAMASRWGFEAMVTYLGYNNSYQAVADTMVERYQDYGRKYSALQRKGNLTAEEKITMQDYKDKKDSLENVKDNFEKLNKNKYGNSGIRTALEVDDKILKNFTEGKTHIYPMFIGKKKLPVIHNEISTAFYNSLVLVFMTILFSTVTVIILKFRFR